MPERGWRKRGWEGGRGEGETERERASVKDMHAQMCFCT